MAIAAGLLLLVAIAYGGATRNGFVAYDDGVYVSDNPHVRSGLSGGSVAWAFTTFENSNWHPLTWLSHMADVEMFGLDAGRHHVTSVVLHAASSILLFLLLGAMTGTTWRPALVAALFAVHPLHVESVAWIAERKDVLSTLLGLLALTAWLRWLRSSRKAAYGAAIAFYAASLMAKPMLVTFPFLLMLLDFWPLERAAFPPRWKEKLPLLALSAASCVVTIAAQRAGGALQTLERIPLPSRLANAAVTYATYLVKTIRPSPLAVFYPYPSSGHPVWEVVVAVVLLAAITAAAFRFRSAAPWALTGWLFYLVALVPVIGIVQVGEQSMADRYTYLPLVGVFVVVAWGAGAIAERGRAALSTASCVALAALVVLTRGQVALWSDSVTLFTHAIAVTDGNWAMRNNLGGVLSREGKSDAALAQFEEVARLRPEFAEGQYNLALELANRGSLPEAIDRYQRALRLRPDYVEAHYNLGNALLHAKRLDDAIREYGEALRLRPGDARAHNNLAIALARAGRDPEAIEHYREAVRLEPGFAEAHFNLGGALVRAGRPEEALEELRAAVRARPDYVEAREAAERLSQLAPRSPRP